MAGDSVLRLTMEAEEDITGTTPPEKRVRRTQLLERKKSVEGIIKAAYLQNDPLDCFPSFQHYRKNGLYLTLGSGSGKKLSPHLKQYMKKLLQVNMEVAFGSDWAAEEKSKKKEMVAPEARYVFVYEYISMRTSEGSKIDVVAGFLHYRFLVEEGVPVLYVYELQLESHIQGKGVGNFLMQLVELIALKNKMAAVLLTVQKANVSAMKFYMDKLGYIISATSPSRVQYLTGLETNYEILCKVLDHDEAQLLE